jgi:hypothetical protein
LNLSAYTAIDNNPELFKIVTPINVDLFESYLINHPNRAYVNSVCRGLRDGFWPWATHDDPNLWQTYDHSHRPINQTERMDFVREQRDEEIKLGRWSPSFGSQFHLAPLDRFLRSGQPPMKVTNSETLFIYRGTRLIQALAYHESFRRQSPYQWHCQCFCRLRHTTPSAPFQ